MQGAWVSGKMVLIMFAQNILYSAQEGYIDIVINPCHAVKT